MPLIAQASEHISRVIHRALFFLPSPGNHSLPSIPDTPPQSAFEASLDEIISEPGETRALAAGVGPLSFAGSGYGIALVLMAILLNRIHHIVRRPRRAPPRNTDFGDTPLGRLRAAVSSFLTSPATGRFIRVPGVLALTRAWLLLSILLLQVANLWPTKDNAIIRHLGSWADLPMDNVCWQVFLSVCAGLACGGMANGLDTVQRRDVGAQFNLFGYSFLLHLYSSPLTHHSASNGSYGRPDVHALFQLWLNITEMAWLQAIELSMTLRNNILLPTGVCGTLGLVHFVYTLWTSPLKLPSFTFMTHLMALFLCIIIVFSVVLKALTMLFTYGYIPSISSLLPHEGVIPRKEEDFGIVLLRLGTACIEATQYSGLRNEVAVIEQRAPWVELSTTTSDVHKSGAGGFSTEIVNIEIADMQGAEGRSVYWQEMRAFWHTCGTTLSSFAWSLIMATPAGRKLVVSSKAAWHRRWWYGPRQWRVWQRDAWREPPLTVARRRLAEHHGHRPRALPVATSTAVQLRPEQPDRTVYSRFLLGQEEIEDDDDDWQDDATSTSSSQGGDSDEEEQALYRDLVEEETEEIQTVLLAHLTSKTSTPLTRRRYASLRSPQGLQDVVQDRRVALADQVRDEDDEERKRACVVCMTQSRDTILWPCRCLALCSDCRESLAARLVADDHMCPCCRRKVDGYSRIYVP